MQGRLSRQPFDAFVSFPRCHSMMLACLSLAYSFPLFSPNDIYSALTAFLGGLTTLGRATREVTWRHFDFSPPLSLAFSRPDVLPPQLTSHSAS